MGEDEADESESIPSSARGLSYHNVMDPSRWSEIENGLRAAKACILPHPFDNLTSFVSDVDASNNEKLRKYIDTLSVLLGFDFGDSIFLLHDAVFPKPNANELIGRLSHQAFVGPDGRDLIARELIDPEIIKIDAQRVSSTRHLVDAYHHGDIDHFHTFFPKGPRVQKLTAFYEGASLVLRPPNLPAPKSDDRVFDNTGQFFSALVLLSGRSTPQKCCACLRTMTGEHSFEFELYKNTVIEFADLPSVGPTLNIRKINEIQVDINGSGLLGSFDEWGAISAYLIHASTNFIQQIVSDLVDRFGIQSPLITGHAGFHFRTRGKARRLDREHRETLSHYPGDKYRIASFGTIEEQSGLTLDTDADGCQSVSKAVPDAVNDLGQRFVIPCGFVCLPQNSAEPRELLRPAEYQSGDKTLVAARVNPRLDAASKRAGHSLASNFSRKVDLLLSELEGKRGLTSPLYTHLGIFSSRLEQAAALSEGKPYFADSSPLQELSRRHFGRAGAPANETRIGVFRASVLYGYILALLNVGEIVKRVDDRIEIFSFKDPKTDKVWPQSPADLFGLTFYVDDPGRAEILLDGVPLRHVGTNLPDETGQASVSILESNHRFCLDEIDFASAGDGHPNAPCLEEQGNGVQALRRFRRFKGRGAGTAVVWSSAAVDCFGMRGAQMIGFDVRATAPARIMAVIVTKRGLRLALGDQAFAEANDCDCCADIRLGEACHVWRTVTAALWNCRWLKMSDVPPNDPPRRIEIHVTAPEGAGVDISEFRYMRPRIASAREENGLVLTGRIVAPEGDVHLTNLETGDSTKQSADYQGYFCFTGLRSGVYDVRDLTTGKTKIFTMRHHRAGMTLVPV